MSAPGVTQTESEAVWAQLPAWGIAPNLVPPEVHDSRHLKVVRRRVVLALGLLLVLCLVAFALATFRSHSSQNELSAAQARTAQLNATQAKYANVMAIQGNVAKVKEQLTGLMANDVSFAAAVDEVRQRLPEGMTITQLVLTVDVPKPGQAGSASKGAPGASLDTSGQKHIGTVKITGGAATITDVSGYIDALKTVKGFVAPYPLTSNAGAQGGVQYDIEVTVTDVLLTHKYDAGKGGGN